jgi:hypothetical protein
MAIQKVQSVQGAGMTLDKNSVKAKDIGLIPKSMKSKAASQAQKKSTKRG